MLFAARVMGVAGSAGALGTTWRESFAIKSYCSGIEALTRNKLVVSLFHNFDLTSLKSQLKQSNDILSHELGCYCAATDTGKILFDKSYILRCLHNTNLILATLGLNGNNVVTASFIDTNVELIDFDLANVLHCSAKMVLKAVSG